MKSALANQLGMDVIVTDHHQTDEAHASGCRRDESSSGRRAAILFGGSVPRDWPTKSRRPISCATARRGVPLESLLDLVALATIADVVPLQDENRGLCEQGLVQISRGARCGIRALKQVAGVTRDCTAETIAFKLAPRLNAAGRLDHAHAGSAAVDDRHRRPRRSGWPIGWSS